MHSMWTQQHVEPFVAHEVRIGRRVIYRVTFRGAGVGWYCGDDVEAHIAQLNETHRRWSYEKSHH